MKKAFAIFCAVILMPGLNAHAWVGGPFSNNNNLTSGDDGVYEAIATAKNGTGMYRWAVRNNGIGASGSGSDVNTLTPQSGNVLFGGGTLGTVSSNVWYYKGIVYHGRAFGTVNSGMGIVSVIANAAAMEDSEFINNIPAEAVSGTNVTSSNGIDVTVIPPVASGVTVIPGSVLVQSRPQPYPATANSSFTAKMKGKIAKRFSGSGIIAFTREPASLRIIGFSLGASTDVTIDGATTTGEGPNDFSEQGHQVKFKVMGTQVSNVVSP